MKFKISILNYLIAAIWFINGFFCKVLHLVPRHQEIVARILDNNSSGILTFLIGLSEVLMAVWIVSRRYSIINAITQILVITAMNTLEFFFVPDLLLWGRLNAVFAFLFIGIIYYNEFYLNKKIVLQA